MYKIKSNSTDVIPDNYYLRIYMCFVCECHHCFVVSLFNVCSLFHFDSSLSNAAEGVKLGEGTTLIELLYFKIIVF